MLQIITRRIFMSMTRPASGHTDKFICHCLLLFPSRMCAYLHNVHVDPIHLQPFALIEKTYFGLRWTHSPADTDTFHSFNPRKWKTRLQRTTMQPHQHFLLLLIPNYYRLLFLTPPNRKVLVTSFTNPHSQTTRNRPKEDCMLTNLMIIGWSSRGTAVAM